jgi:hypothetical protein
MLRQCILCWSIIKQPFIHFIFPGDSGYPLEPWLMTPLSTTTSQSEVAYQSAHTKTRNVVERCFGVMKSRFRCLDKSGGTLLYSAEKACRIFVAVSVLHNYCISRSIPTTVDTGVVARSATLQPPTVIVPPHPTANRHGTAVELRRELVRQF